MLAIIGFILIVSALLLGLWWFFLQGTPFGQLPLMVVGCALMWLIALSFPQITLLPSPYLFLVGGGLLIASVGLARTYVQEQNHEPVSPPAEGEAEMEAEAPALASRAEGDAETV
ncbi:hypothetical protein GTO91_17250, partial [Heliobacterium undosum]